MKKKNKFGSFQCNIQFGKKGVHNRSGFRVWSVLAANFYTGGAKNITRGLTYNLIIVIYHFSGLRRIYFSRGRKKYQVEQKKNQVGQNPPHLKKILPPRQNSILPLGQNRQEGGQKTLLYLEKEGETFYDRSLSNPQLTVLFFL